MGEERRLFRLSSLKGECREGEEEGDWEEEAYECVRGGGEREGEESAAPGETERANLLLPPYPTCAKYDDGDLDAECGCPEPRPPIP